MPCDCRKSSTHREAPNSSSTPCSHSSYQVMTSIIPIWSICPSFAHIQTTRAIQKVVAVEYQSNLEQTKWVDLAAILCIFLKMDIGKRGAFILCWWWRLIIQDYLEVNWGSFGNGCEKICACTFEGPIWRRMKKMPVTNLELIIEKHPRRVHCVLAKFHAH